MLNTIPIIKEMSRDPSVNFIVIASPNYFHYEQAIDALRNNCDVLIEKPVSFEEKRYIRNRKSS